MKLLPPISPEELKNRKGAWDYRTIRPQTLLVKTGRYESPLLKYMPDLDQFDRGTCVGHAACYWLSANYYFCTGKVPDDKEMVLIRDVIQNLGSCSVRYDAFWQGILSQQWFYQAARKEGNCTYPEGAFSGDMAKAAVHIGGVPWDQCITPKKPDCVPQSYPAGEDACNKIAEGHRLTGFATALNWETVKEMIAESGGRGVIFATNLYDDYTDLDEQGRFRYHPGGHVAGSHELWAYGVDWDNDLILIKNSWDKIAQYPKMTKEYYEDNVGPVYACIDSEEVIIGQQKYTKLLISAKDNKGVPVQITFTIDGETPIDTQIESGIQHIVRANPVYPLTYNEPSLSQYVTATEQELEKAVVFTFTRKETPTPPTPPKWDWKTWMKDLFKKLFGKTTTPEETKGVKPTIRE